MRAFFRSSPSSLPRVDFSQEAAIILLDQICPLLRDSICRRHDVTADMSWKHRRVDHPQILDAFHAQPLVQNLAHSARSYEMILRGDVVPNVLGPLFLGLNLLTLRW